MSKSNTHNSSNHNPKPRKKNRPGWRRVVVGYRMVPMQASHVDEIAIAEARARGDHKWMPMAGMRCSKCWLKNPRAGHFCMWDIPNAIPPAHNLPMRQVPIYKWVGPDE
jgi:hypothetical protein